MAVDLNGIGQGQVNTHRSTAEKPSSSQSARQTAPEQTNARAEKSQGDKVNLSSQARNLKQLEEKLGSYPEVDDNRVAEIRSALENGTYKVDAEKLAQKMLDMDESIFG
ncbi:flagellar biosynthesis anti-sigma factor FlgM [Marinobacter adhaerens]|uniref:Negative regulator of flagellin synthesis n=1 Tax=Marinobacter adhaerens TaxID=1033846 RepID=A0A851HLE7_9GAMM|nr:MULTISPECIES: flagellar biosynthesis anti-sigma factor FlgM [Marinobacter]NWN90679.1 flagellar biosynthesis anti-sigma factor FlgM [Marinobacter adhaerens]